MISTITQIRQNERAEIENRKSEIYKLLKKYSLNRGWKNAFLTSNPMFNNSAGITMITNGHARKASNLFFLVALQEFDKHVQLEQPDWYKIKI